MLPPLFPHPPTELSIKAKLFLMGRGVGGDYEDHNGEIFNWAVIKTTRTHSAATTEAMHVSRHDTKRQSSDKRPIIVLKLRIEALIMQNLFLKRVCQDCFTRG